MNISLDIKNCHYFLHFFHDFFCWFRSATGEAWQEIMLDCIHKPEARCDPKSDDKGKYKPNLSKGFKGIVCKKEKRVERLLYPGKAEP